MTRPLNSDELGKIGEAQFALMSSKAGLVANPSSFDRTGWDYVVDWRLANDGRRSLDMRPPPRSSRVQVKTVWSDVVSVSMRLSSADHLSKGLTPAFIVAVRVDENKAVVESLIAHIEGDLLARILKALRQAHADCKAPNKISISLSLNAWFTPLGADPDAVRAFMESAIGESMERYTQLKQKQLDDLGFDADRITMSTTVVGEDAHALTDAMLGLRPLDARDVSASETRFGISLPVPELQAKTARFEVKPSPMDKGFLIARGAGETFRFKLDIFGVPKGILPPREFKNLLRADLFDLLMWGEATQSGKWTFKLNITTDARRTARARISAREWADFYGFVTAMFDGPVETEIHQTRLDEPLTGTMTLSERDGEGDPSNFIQVLQLARAARRVLDATDWPGTKISLAQMRDAGWAFRVLDMLISAPEKVTPLTFNTASDYAAPDLRGSVLYASQFELGPHNIAFAVMAECRATVNGDSAEWVSEQLKFVGADRIKRSASDYKRFVERMQRATSVQELVNDTRSWP